MTRNQVNTDSEKLSPHKDINTTVNNFYSKVYQILGTYQSRNNKFPAWFSASTIKIIKEN